MILLVALGYFVGAALVDSLYVAHTRALAAGLVVRGTILAMVTAGLGAGGILGMAIVSPWLLIPFVLGCGTGTFLTLHYKVDDLIGTAWAKFTRGEGRPSSVLTDSRQTT